MRIGRYLAFSPGEWKGNCHRCRIVRGMQRPLVSPERELRPVLAIVAASKSNPAEVRQEPTGTVDGWPRPGLIPHTAPRRHHGRWRRRGARFLAPIIVGAGLPRA